MSEDEKVNWNIFWKKYVPEEGVAYGYSVYVSIISAKDVAKFGKLTLLNK